MRLEVLNSGYGIMTKMLFRVVRLMLGFPMPDAARLVFYRPNYYGAQMKEFTHQAMRGPSQWSVADRELMAAYISTVNRSAFCIAAHTATASKASERPEAVQAVLENLDTGPIDDRLRATLRMLGNLAQRHTVEAGEMRALLDAGVSRQQIEDALAVYFAFSATNRLADAFGFELLSPEGYAAGAKVLLSRGYR